MDESTKRLYGITEAERSSRSSGMSRSKDARLPIVKPWLLDLLSLLLATALVIAIALLFKKYDGQPVPSWPFVTFNFVISILAKAISAAIGLPLADCLGQLKWHWYWKRSRPQPVAHFQAYSNASTGAWGSFAILCKPRLWHFASLGAILAIAVLAIDPFFQQMPTYPIRLIHSSKPAAISVASTYIDVTLNLVGGQRDDGLWYMLSDEAKGAFYSGIYNAKGALTVQPSCSTGNCTWEPYTTLGFCSACANISSTLVRSINEADYDSPGYQWNSPEGLDIDENTDVMTVRTDFSTSTYAHLQNYTIVDLTSIYFGDAGQWIFMDPTPPNAWECILYFCVQQYRSLVEGGDFHEELLSVFPEPSTTSSLAHAALQIPRPMYSASPLPGGERLANVSASHPSGGASVSSPLYGYKNFTLNPPGTSKTYTVDPSTVILMREWMQSLLPASIYRSAAADESPGDMAEVLYESQRNDGGPEALMQRLAASLTTRVRNLAGSTADGSAQVPQTFIHVRWIWFALPVLVLALTILFMAGTMIWSAVQRVPVWGCSSLPSLLYPLDHETAAAISDAGPVLSKMEKSAERFSMAMSFDDGWKLQGVRSKNN